MRLLLMKKIFLFLTYILVSLPCFCEHLYLEKEYQSYWCKANNGQLEYKLQDSTRIDCLTKDYAIEFDFAPKWAESIGQALYYALSVNKKAGVVLILECKEKDIKYLERLQKVAKLHNIKIWTVTPQDIYRKRTCDY